MRFQPKTEDQLAEENLLPKGDYPFRVMKAEEKKSKKGNDMIAMKVAVFDVDNDVEQHVFDFLLESMAFKLRHFCYATGLHKEYDNGTLTASMCEGREGYCTLDVQGAKDGYAPKNVIKDYLAPAQVAEQKEEARPAPAKQAKKDDEVAEDDVPF